MYLTKEDLEKIRKYIVLNGVKDSQFPEQNVLMGDEYITLINTSGNRKMKISQLFSLIEFPQEKDFNSRLTVLEEVTDSKNVKKRNTTLLKLVDDNKDKIEKLTLRVDNHFKTLKEHSSKLVEINDNVEKLKSDLDTTKSKIAIKIITE